jgi:hypothetical protein
VKSDICVLVLETINGFKEADNSFTNLHMGRLKFVKQTTQQLHQLAHGQTEICEADNSFTNLHMGRLKFVKSQFPNHVQLEISGVPNPDQIVMYLSLI